MFLRMKNNSLSIGDRRLIRAERSLSDLTVGWHSGKDSKPGEDLADWVGKDSQPEEDSR